MNSKELKIMMTILICAAIGLVFIIGLLVGKEYLKSDNEKRLERDNKYMSETYLRKHGGTSTYGEGEIGKDFVNYDLRSWDAGKNWYAVDYDFDTETVKIMGEAEEVYPGLLKHLEAWDALTNHVIENGSITLNGDRAQKDAEILNNAGFEIKKGDTCNEQTN